MLVITLGDPHSINIEKIVQLLPVLNPLQDHFSTILVGSYWHWQDQLERLGHLQNQSVKLSRISSIDDIAVVTEESLVYFFDIGGEEAPAELLAPLQRGLIACKALMMSVEISKFLEKNFAEHARRLAVLTAPIDKFACSKAGFDFPGQTEFFEKTWHQEGIMLLAGDKLKVGLLTNHIPVSAVESMVNEQLIHDKLRALEHSLLDIFNISLPKIAVCGLNPHCGDGGLFGDFDQKITEKSLLSYQGHSKVSGPYSADTVFWQAMGGSFDAVLAMYHDQGLPALKTLCFDTAVNITGGLEHLRISPDHGPAKDHFLLKTASISSFERALDIALGYIRTRAIHKEYGKNEKVGQHLAYNEIDV
ncbi:MAG: 4-hydroxythreonine-4-phosphate dehydrogenase PdxA [Bdellovibrionota bacterium]